MRSHWWLETIWSSYEPETSPLQTLSIMRWLRLGSGWINYCINSVTVWCLMENLFIPCRKFKDILLCTNPDFSPFRLRFTWHIKRRLSNALLLWFLQKASHLCCRSTLLTFNGNQRHLKPPRTADTHTRWKLPAKSGGAAFESAGGILLLAAQLRDSG